MALANLVAEIIDNAGPTDYNVGVIVQNDSVVNTSGETITWARSSLVINMGSPGSITRTATADNGKATGVRLTVTEAGWAAETVDFDFTGCGQSSPWSGCPTYDDNWILDITNITFTIS